MSAPDRYFSKKARWAWPAAPWLHGGSFESLWGVPTITPMEFSSPAGFSVPATELDGKLIISVGFQPISAALRMACAANFGVPATSSAAAPELFSDTTWESLVGSVTS